MRTEPVQPAPLPPSAAADPASLQAFVADMLRRLGAPLETRGANVLRLVPPLAARDWFEQRDFVDFTFDKETYDRDENQDLELAVPGGRLLGWVIDEARKLGAVAQAAAGNQPQEIADLVKIVCGAYLVDGGDVQLTDGVLEDRPILCVTFRIRLEGIEPRDQLAFVCVSGEGDLLDEDQAALLGVREPTVLDRPPAIEPQVVRALSERALERGRELAKLAEARLQESLAPRRNAEEKQLRDYFRQNRAELHAAMVEANSAAERRTLREQIQLLDQEAERRLSMLGERFVVRGEVHAVASMLAWCKHAQATVRLAIAGRGVEVSLRGWARLLRPPPALCPATGIPTFHLASTSDGRIAAAEAIAACQQSRRRVLNQELETCSLTGQRVLPEYLVLCNATGRRALAQAMTPCKTCGCSVAPDALQDGVCQACRHPAEAPKGDPRLARLLAQHPGLAGWTWRQLVSGQRCWTWIGQGWVRRMLISVNRESLAVERLATGKRFFSGWHDVPKEQWAAILGN